MNLKKSKILHFPKGLVHNFWSKIGNFVPVQFLSKIVRNKVFCDLLDRKLAIGVSLWFLVKNRKVSTSLVFQQDTPKQSVLGAYRQKYSHLRLQKYEFGKVENCYFSKRGRLWLFKKNWKICPFLFLFIKIGQSKWRFVTLQIEIYPLKPSLKYRFKKSNNLHFFSRLSP